MNVLAPYVYDCFLNQCYNLLLSVFKKNPKHTPRQYNGYGFTLADKGLKRNFFITQRTMPIVEKDNIKYKISFCTVCMNRLDHLKKTLPKNIRDAIPYGNVEFIVLNYNSKDGLDTWMESQMLKYIESGILKYYKTTEPDYFHMSHSKNVAAKKASGDIICNVDADNFIGKGFAEYVNSIFVENRNAYVTVDKKNSPSDCYGRICVSREDFHKMRGYDEDMVGYGAEDYDFCQRLDLLKRRPYFIKNPDFLRALNHSNVVRLQNSIEKIHKAYLGFVNHAITEFLFLFEDNTFLKTKMVLNQCLYSTSIENLFESENSNKSIFSLFNNEWEEGSWYSIGNEIEIRMKDRLEIIFLQVEKKILKSSKNNTVEYRQMENSEEIADSILLLRLLKNSLISSKNKSNKKITVNDVGFGVTPLFQPFLIRTDAQNNEPF